MYCEKCGNFISEGEGFCGKCGAPNPQKQGATPLNPAASSQNSWNGGKMSLWDKIKMSFGCLTVKIALAAVILTFVSIYLPWLTDRTRSQSLAEAIAAKPKYFAGMPVVLIVGLLWIAVWFLLNHPKLTLIGVLPLSFICMSMISTASNYHINLGFGFFLYILMIIVCVVMAFLTKKKKNHISGMKS